jgi:hypothetical protein
MQKSNCRSEANIWRHGGVGDLMVENRMHVHVYTIYINIIIYVLYIYTYINVIDIYHVYT